MYKLANVVDQIEKVSDTTAEQIKKEMIKLLDNVDVSRFIEKPSVATAEQIKKEMIKLLDNVDVDKVTKKLSDNLTKQVEKEIVDLFRDLDIVKQVSYEIIYKRNEMRLFVIYEHDDFKYAFDVIYHTFMKLQYKFSDIDMDFDVMLPTEIEPNLMEHATIALKR